MTTSYRQSHLEPSHVQRYIDTYQHDTYDQRVWQLEKYVLDIIRRKWFGPTAIEAQLDFATGTGRLCEYWQPHVKHIIALDTSVPMLAHARRQYPGVTFIAGDLTRALTLPRTQFPLITAFRFFLNAEPSLRRLAMQALAAKLSPNGIIILNIHGNTHSWRHLVLLLRRLVKPKAKPLSEVSQQDIANLARDHGLRVVAVHGVSYLPIIWATILPSSAWLALERTLYRFKLLTPWATDLIFVLTHDPSPSPH